MCPIEVVEGGGGRIVRSTNIVLILCGSTQHVMSYIYID